MGHHSLFASLFTSLDLLVIVKPPFLLLAINYKTCFRSIYLFYLLATFDRVCPINQLLHKSHSDQFLRPNSASTWSKPLTSLSRTTIAQVQRRVESTSSSLTMRFQRLSKTFELSAQVNEASATKTLNSIESSQISCFKAVTLQKVVVLVRIPMLVFSVTDSSGGKSIYGTKFEDENF